MSGTFEQSVICIVIVAICTFFTRVFPFLLFGRKKEVPSPVLYLGNLLPPAVMCILVIYCLKNISFSTPAGFLPEAISVILVALLHLWKRNNLLSIGAGTITYMLLIQFVFV